VTAGDVAPEDVSPERQAIVDDIERTREEMGRTVEALAAKADVKAQAQRKAAEVAGTARQQARRGLAAVGQRRDPLIVAAAGVGAGLLTWLLTRPLRRS
jgi:hypothetical protein